MTKQPHTPIVTLTTDFGTKDHYVAAMKGALLSISPETHIIDVTHEINPHDILAGAFILHHSVRWFPQETIHVAVVDPGVGTQRRILAGRWNGQVVIAPDNGLVSLLHTSLQMDVLYEVTNEDYFLPEISRTFHGRDIMAPIAAHLARGAPLASVGPRMEKPQTIRLPEIMRQGNSIHGEILYVDHFGNLITNIRSTHIGPSDRCCVHIRHHQIELANLFGSYDTVRSGKLLALVGSAGYIEIACNQSNAQQLLNVTSGDSVVLSFL